MTFVRRRIDLSIRLGQGTYGESGFNTISVKGLRVSASIVRGGGVSFNTAQIRVWGLTPDVLNQLVTVGPVVNRSASLSYRQNTITVSAGDDESGMGVVFIGDIWHAWADFNDLPEPSLTISASTGILASKRPVPPTSIKGAADVALVMSGLAKLAGFNFEKGGVDVRLSNPYLSGTATDQIAALARAADINYVIDDNTLAIWPKGSVRNGVVPGISAETGMVGYPSFTEKGISVRTLFNPNYQFLGRVRVDSDLKPASGFWTPYMIAHDLEAEVPNGKWFTRMECVQYGNPIPV